MSSKIVEFSKMAPKPVSLSNLFQSTKSRDPAQRIRNALYLHQELPVRLAQRIEELKLIPFNLGEKRSVIETRQLYEQSFDSILSSPEPSTMEIDEKFTEILLSIHKNHVSVVQNVALGVLEVKAEAKFTFTTEQSNILNDYLNRFFMARIGARLLIEQHIFSKGSRDGFSGVIQSNCNPYDVAKQASEAATELCIHSVGVCPKFIFKSPDPTDTFTYLPSHLYYILLELFKNSTRATVNFHGVDADLPHIEVVVARGKSDVTIKVSDQGGGIPRHKMPRLWEYCLTSSSSSSSKFIPAQIALLNSSGPSLSGYGCGLPLSRLYAQYFGGNLDLKSIEGFGTDAYCHLSRLGNNCENLPKGVLNSPSERDSSL
jgi:pyruvate dehydrogenase kinase 2/3/4